MLREPDGVERFLEQTIGGEVVDLRAAIPGPTRRGTSCRARWHRPGTYRSAAEPDRHWAIAQGYERIEHAQLVVVNVCDDGQRDRAAALLADLARLRKDRQVFDDVLGWRGTRAPITAVAADLSDERDPGTRKAVARVRRAVQRASAP